MFQIFIEKLNEKKKLIFHDIFLFKPLKISNTNWQLKTFFTSAKIDTGKG